MDFSILSTPSPLTAHIAGALEGERQHQHELDRVPRREQHTPSCASCNPPSR